LGGRGEDSGCGRFNSDNQPVAMVTASARNEVKLGNGNTVTQ